MSGDILRFSFPCNYRVQKGVCWVWLKVTSASVANNALTLLLSFRLFFIGPLDHFFCCVLVNFWEDAQRLSVTPVESCEVFFLLRLILQGHWPRGESRWPPSRQAASRFPASPKGDNPALRRLSTWRYCFMSLCLGFHVSWCQDHHALWETRSNTNWQIVD